MLVVVKQDVIVVVQGETTIGNNGIKRIQVQTISFIFEEDLCAEVNTLASLGIKEGEGSICSGRREFGCCFRFEYNLLVAWTVLHASAQTNYISGILIDVPLNGIEHDGSCVQTMEIALSIDAQFGIAVENEVELVEIVPHGLHNVGHRILVAALQT